MIKVQVCPKITEEMIEKEVHRQLSILLDFSWSDGLYIYKTITDENNLKRLLNDTFKYASEAALGDELMIQFKSKHHYVEFSIYRFTDSTLTGTMRDTYKTNGV